MNKKQTSSRCRPLFQYRQETHLPSSRAVKGCCEMARPHHPQARPRGQFIIPGAARGHVLIPMSTTEPSSSMKLPEPELGTPLSAGRGRLHWYSASRVSSFLHCCSWEGLLCLSAEASTQISSQGSRSDAGKWRRTVGSLAPS